MKIVRTALLFAIVLVGACANYEPASVGLAAGSKDKAVLLLEVDPVKGADFNLNTSEYDEANKAVLSTPFTGYANFTIMPGKRYVAQTVAPGTYAVTWIAQQTYWAACMHDNSLAFDVRPGEVLYLGRFDPARQLRYIHDQAIARGQLATQERYLFYFDNVPPLAFDFGPDHEAQRLAVEAYVKAEMPKVTAPVRLAEYRPAKFGTGYSLVGDHLCTGYFKEKVK